jgi:nucleotide-binding universal stress UspA family protein
MYQRILVPVDGSPTSLRGLEEAIKLAKEQRAALKLLHVVEEYPAVQGGLYGAGAYAGDLLNTLRSEGERIIAEASALADRQGIKTEAAVMESLSSRSSEIIVQNAKAWRADLIVMGTHGRRGVSHLVLGSDAEIVVRTASVPVLLVRAPE